MVLHHIAQRTGLLIEWPAAFNADTLSCRNLHMIDKIAVPDRLKNPVREAKDQDVLHRLLAEVVIDAEDLFLIKNLVHLVIQLPGRFQIMSERLFDDYARMALFRMRHAMVAE